MKTYPKETFVNAIGEKSGPTAWYTVDQERIDAFADCTGDHQFIHVNPEMAAKTPFGGTIAHGMLTLSLLPAMLPDCMIAPENTVMGVNYGFNKIRFLTPVRAGKRIRMRTEITAIDAKDANRFLVTTDVTIEIEDEEKPALIAQWMNMFFTA